MRWGEWLGVGERRWKKAPDEEVQPGKTLWDWLQLLIVPAILIGVTFAWGGCDEQDNAREEGRIAADNKREDRRIAADRRAAEKARQDATLQSYLDQMSHLMLDKKLLSKPSDQVRSVARTVTLTALRRLDGERKAEVARFLSEAKLLGNPNGNDVARVTSPQEPLVKLFAADLSDADLRGAFLPGIDFSEVNLSGADLRQSLLWYSSLSSAHLPGADLQGAQLSNATLDNADLQSAPG